MERLNTAFSFGERLPQPESDRNACVQLTAFDFSDQEQEERFSLDVNDFALKSTEVKPLKVEDFETSFDRSVTAADFAEMDDVPFPEKGWKYALGTPERPRRNRRRRATHE